jgi:hypothetical protein
MNRADILLPNSSFEFFIIISIIFHNYETKSTNYTNPAAHESSQSYTDNHILNVPWCSDSLKRKNDNRGLGSSSGRTPCQDDSVTTQNRFDSGHAATGKNRAHGGSDRDGSGCHSNSIKRLNLKVQFSSTTTTF